MRKPFPVVLPLLGLASLLGATVSPVAASAHGGPESAAVTMHDAAWSVAAQSAPSPAPAPAPEPAPAPAPATVPEPQTAPAPSATPAAAGHQEVTVADSASPELVGAITKELGVTPTQAQGGAGALLGLAKTRLKTDEFAKVSAAVPGTDALLKAAPAAKGLAGIGGGMGGALGLASLAGSFKQLGLSPAQAAKMVPVLTNFVQSKGAGEAATLLGGVLK